MTTGHSTSGSARRIAKRGGHRVLGVKVWLGAGALAVGVGAAVAGASGVASADTGDHHAPGSASASKHEAASSAGPKRSTADGASNAAPASAKHLKARSVKVVAAGDTSARPAAASSAPGILHKATASPLAAISTAAQTSENTQTIDTPFGPITLATKTVAPDLGTSGPLSLDVNAATPIGGVEFSLAGSQTFTSSPLVNEVAITSGTFVASAPVAFLASAAGSLIAGGLAAYGSATTFVTALQGGDLVGALLSYSTVGAQFIGGFLFGDQTLTLPFEIPATGQAIELHVPVSGIFGPVRSISVTVPAYSYVDETTGVELKLDGANFDFAGTKLGGSAWKLIGF
ncbi:hypothetical protein BH09ACT8_BH09ACT8_20840 [soil metagenome]